MKLCKLTRWAAIGAVVLTFALHSQEAHAQCATTAGETIDAEVPYTMDMCATINNVFTADVTDLDFGTVGATHKNLQYGCLIMDDTGALDETNATCSSADADRARLVSDDQTGTAGLISIGAGGAFNSQEVRMLIQVADPELTCQGTSPPLIIGALESDQTTPATWDYTGPGNVAADNTAAVTGFGNTGAGGDLDIVIFGELRTDSSAADNLVYESGACLGQFTVTMFY